MLTIKGSKLTTKHKEAISKALKGKMPKNIKLIAGWNRGLKMSREYCKKISCLNKKGIIGMKGRKHTNETKEKQRKNNKTKLLWQNPEYRKMMSESKQRLLVGKNNPAYIDGRTLLTERIRHCKKSQDWIKSIFERDNYTCQDCKKRGEKLIAHHNIKSFSKIFSDNNIKTFRQAMYCEAFWNIGNGLTLCEKCHKNKHKKVI